MTERIGLPETASFQLVGPWDAPGTEYFYGGQFSSFAQVPGGLVVPTGYLGHPNGETCRAFYRENWFQACKASDKETFLKILNAAKPAQAKFMGGRRGIIKQLRPDWDEISYAVMLDFARRQWHLPGWRQALLETCEATLVERSTQGDTLWGGYNPKTDTYDGQNLLGICLMQVRAELLAELAPTTD